MKSYVRIAVIAAIILVLLAAVSAGTLLALGSHDAHASNVPEFEYRNEPAQTEAAAQEIEPASPAETVEAESEQTDSPTADSQAPDSQTAPVLLTSNDPLHCMKITFDGFNIDISGFYEGKTVTEAFLGHGNSNSDIKYDGDNMFHVTISAQYDQTSQINGYDTLFIQFDGEVNFSYRLAVTETGFALVDASKVLQKNTKLSENPVKLPEEGVRGYISADGDSETVSETLAQVREISDKICEGIDSDYDKLRAIAEWVSSNIYYDFDASVTSVTDETVCLSHILETHRTICTGFANIFAALCGAQGIYCENFRGAAVYSETSFAEQDDGEFHEWNCAIIDGRRIWVDTVWDTYNSYVNENYFESHTKLEYFDVTDEAFSVDHRGDVCEIRDYFGEL